MERLSLDSAENSGAASSNPEMVSSAPPSEDVPAGIEPEKEKEKEVLTVAALEGQDTREAHPFCEAEVVRMVPQGGCRRRDPEEVQPPGGGSGPIEGPCRPALGRPPSLQACPACPPSSRPRSHACGDFSPCEYHEMYFFRLKKEVLFVCDCPCLK